MKFRRMEIKVRKAFGVFLFSAAFMAASAFPSLANGSWKSDSSGWTYVDDDGTTPKNMWQVVDGKYYYFDENGYCLRNTTAPDGRELDETGAWTRNGFHMLRMYEEWTEPTTIKVDAPTLEDTGICSLIHKNEAEILETLGEAKKCMRDRNDAGIYYTFKGHPGVIFDIDDTTNAGRLCFRIYGPAAAFFKCSGADTITRSQLEQALGVEISIGQAWYEERWYAEFVYNDCHFSIFSCSADGTFQGDSVVSVIHNVKHDAGFEDESGQWLSI